MAQFTQLRDFYTFSGCRPHAHIRGVSGDPFAVLITLLRLRKKKKQPADTAAPAIAPSMIKASEPFAISTAADGASTSKFPFAASAA